MNCPKCKAKMNIGQVIRGSYRLIEGERINCFFTQPVITSENIETIKCWKCSECGHSETYDTNPGSWNRVIDELPIIPEGKSGMAILVAKFDPCYDECSPGRGYEVRCISYNVVDYKAMPQFEGSIFKEGDPAFMELGLGGNLKYGYVWLPVDDQITHWMYLPTSPKYDPEVLNPIFQWYHDHALPQSPLKQI